MKKYWIWLSMACTPASDTFRKLLSRYTSAKEIFEASREELTGVIGSRSKDIVALSDKDLSAAERTLAYTEKYNIGIVTYADTEYPESLKEIQNPPVLLYYRGVLPDFRSGFFSAVVGTRRLSEYGRRMAFAIGADLASAGAAVVSGMAVGIDGVAMAGALSLGGCVVAVLGSGIDVCYPKAHKTLAKAIVASGGCVLTEYPPKTRPERYNFPKRNRIISGLCAVTAVIEGSEKSGAMITARYAKEQGRAVYALPGNVDNRESRVTNLLIRDGAKLFMSADDIVRDFEEASAGALNPFALAEHKNPEMFSVLREYKISCVTPSDGIFSPKAKLSRPSRKVKVEESISESDELAEPTLEAFDEKTIKVYKSIPTEGECDIESLAEGDVSLRDVMKCLLKLEMGRFVTLTPGERVKRNLK